MKLKSIEIEILSDVDIEEGRFNFFKSLIKKDLEVVRWSNSVVKFFGEFQIYSDYKSELY